MRRKLLTLFAVLCLAVLLAQLVLWVRSNFATDAMWHGRFAPGTPTSTYRLIEVMSGSGSLAVVWRHELIMAPVTNPPAEGLHYNRAKAFSPFDLHDEDSFWNFLGFGRFQRTQVAPPAISRETTLIVPIYATLALPLLGLAWFRWASGRARRRWLSRRCPACGYSLRHLSGGCPECGWRSLAAPEREAVTPRDS